MTGRQNSDSVGNGGTVAAATVAAANDGDNGRGAMTVRVERGFSGTKRRLKVHCSNNVGAAAAAITVTVEADSDNSLNKNRGEIIAKRDNISEPFFEPRLNQQLTACGGQGKSNGRLRGSGSSGGRAR